MEGIAEDVVQVSGNRNKLGYGKGGSDTLYGVIKYD